ncbi:alpha/beta fold hydrolase [Pseudonocardia spinosispora]|uniref:alpha/beta fold hydrolase n=1 Tax=Pseudonocardia spinosispora TaxID=103441 RepID=UPI000411042A|nr:alpha/beta hydrolase [Pseudonocardia spinosispora]
MGSNHAVRTSTGVTLHATVDGPADAPSTVVLAHGWTLDSRSWEPVARTLTSPNGPAAKVIRYDHRAHGRSDMVPREDMTIEALADDLAEVIGELAPSGPLVLGGHSMGGMTIMALAERHPELVASRVAGVALVSTAAGGLADTTLGLSVRMLGLIRKGEARLAKAAWVDRRAALSRRPWLLAPGMRALLVGPYADRGATMTTARCVAACRPATMVGFRPTLDAHERDAALAAFETIPTEVLVGTRDKLTPPGQSRRIVAAATKARLTEFPGAGHMVPLERVHAVSSRISGLVEAAR